MNTKVGVRGRGGNALEQGKDAAQSAVTSPVMEILARLGYLVRGLVYAVIGFLALQVVAGGGGTLTDQQGAIAAISQSPLGGILLYVVFAGLIGYGLWGLIRAILDPEHKGSDSKGLVQRVGYAVSGVSYLVLAYATYGLITGRSSAAHQGAQTAQTQQTTASILSQPWGTWVVGLVALIVIGVGVLQVVRGLRRDLDRQFHPYTLSGQQLKYMVQLAQFGTVARGVVFALVGVFLLLAAITNDPGKAQGIDGVLATLVKQPYGLFALGVVALGLVAFGIYSATCGIWLKLKR